MRRTQRNLTLFPYTTFFRSTAGRDPASLEINAMFGTQMSDPKSGIEEMRDAGVGRIMIPAFFFAGPGGLDRMAALAEQIMPLAAE